MVWLYFLGGALLCFVAGTMVIHVWPFFSRLCLSVTYHFAGGAALVQQLLVEVHLWKMGLPGGCWAGCWSSQFAGFLWTFFVFSVYYYIYSSLRACLLQPSDSSSLSLSWSHLQFSKLWISLCLRLVLVEQTMTPGFTQGQICKLPHIISSFCTNCVVNLLTRLLIFTTSTTIVGCLSSSLLLLPPKSIFFPLPLFI